MSASASSGQLLNLTAVAAATAAWEEAWGRNTSDRPPNSPSGADPAVLAAASLAKFASWDPSKWLAIPDTDVWLPSPPRTFTQVRKCADLRSLGLWCETFVFAPPHCVVAQVGADGFAAVGPDCPFVAEVDGVNLTACEASCLADNQCNGINYNAAGQNCVHRHCLRPLHPELSPNFGGWAYFGLNVSSSCLTHNAWHRDSGVLAVLCAADAAGCAGFASNGNLYSCAEKTVASPGVTLWIPRGPR